MNKTLPNVLSFKLPLLFLILLSLWGYKEIRNKFVQPEAILVLGGSTKKLEREKFTAKFARKHPNLPIVISGGSPNGATKQVFAKAGVDVKRLYLDHDAVDTVTNFTTLVDYLERRRIKSIYLITSKYHMGRAKVIGEIILGSRGINFKAVPVPSRKQSEPVTTSIRDGARALLWVTTGYTVTKQSLKMK